MSTTDKKNFAMTGSILARFLHLYKSYDRGHQIHSMSQEHVSEVSVQFTKDVNDSQQVRSAGDVKMKISYLRKLGDMVGVMLHTLPTNFEAIGMSVDACLNFIERK